jgi:hypothetical protein
VPVRSPLDGVSVGVIVNAERIGTQAEPRCPPLREVVAVRCLHLLLWIGVAASLSACEETIAPIPTEPGILILSGAPAADTVKAPGQPLTVLVINEDGRPAAGATVQFEVVGVPYALDPHYTVYGMLVGPIGAPEFQYQSSAEVTTNRRGQATTGVIFWTLAGPAEVVISVVCSTHQDTAHFTVLPASAAHVVAAPRDTAVYRGGSVGLRGHTTDIWGNPRPDPISWRVGSGPLALQPGTPRAIAGDMGRASVIATSNGLADTAWISVVPEGWIATQEHVPGNGGPVAYRLMQLDGSGSEWLAPGVDNAVIQQGVAWSPDGEELLVAREDRLLLAGPGGSERTVLNHLAPLSPAARFSRDGAWIYFSHGGTQSELAGLFRIRPDGTDVQRVGVAGRERLPAPSHHGRYVAYVSGRTPCGVHDCIRVLDLDSGEDAIYGTDDFLARGTSVAWSPVEDLIAYVGAGALVVVRSDGSGGRVLATGIRDTAWLDFSPDGAWLVVSGATPMLVNVGTGLQLPLGHLASYGATAWRP